MPPFLSMLSLLAISLLSGNAFAKCNGPDARKVVWNRHIDPATLPADIEVTDHVWIRNPGPTSLFTYVSEKGAAARTGYRKVLGDTPTTNDELPGMKLVNGERYEYHFPENPQYTEDSAPIKGGWVHQDYAFGLLSAPLPVVPDHLNERIFAGKTKLLAVRVPVPIYFGKKRSVIQVIYEFTKNAKFGVVDPACGP